MSIELLTVGLPGLRQKLLSTTSGGESIVVKSGLSCLSASHELQTPICLGLSTAEMSHQVRGKRSVKILLLCKAPTVRNLVKSQHSAAGTWMRNGA